VKKPSLLETMSKHIKGKNVVGHSQQGFMKAKSCLTNMMALYSKVTSSVNKWRVVDFVYLN